ncbi:MAG: flagellin/flagellar hook associated protein, partial [Naasia sp.]|nr:flagellin/flagellar hook associated protein [Naasia sp.]
MGMQINTNVSALNTYRNLTSTQNSLSKSLEKLSSGLRINRASDDAAGLTIAEGLKSQIGGLNVAARNAQDGISVVQTAEGALSESQSILQRLRDLSVQAANDSNSASARDALKTEATSLVAELERIGTSTNFNGIKLLDGTQSSLNFQIGANGDDASKVNISLADANLKAIATSLSTGTLSTGKSFTYAASAATAGAYVFSTASGNVTQSVSVTTTAGGAASHKAFADELNANADFAANFRAEVVRDTTTGNSTGISVVALNGSAVNLDTAGAAKITAGVAAPSTAAKIDFTSTATAQASIKAIDTAIGTISKARSGFGALQNRFESAVNTINVSIENLSASKSRLTDVDMASEMVNYTRANILSQSGAAMLAQANQ